MNFRKSLKVIFILILTIGLTSNAFSFGRHKYHTSLTRMDYNAEDKIIEVTIQLFTHDVLPSLEKYSKKSVELEGKPETDQLLFSYLKERFILKNENDVVSEIKWVGKEIKVDLVYVYLEIPFEDKFENLKLKNSLFFENFPEQTNIVVFYFNNEKADFLFKVGDQFKDLKKSVR